MSEESNEHYDEILKIIDIMVKEKISEVYEEKQYLISRIDDLEKKGISLCGELSNKNREIEKLKKENVQYKKLLIKFKDTVNNMEFMEDVVV